MDKNELMSLLNIKPTKGVSDGKGSKDSQVSSTRVSGGRSVGSPEGPSRFALKLDLFDANQGGRLLRHNHRLRETKLEPEAVSDLYAMHYLTSPQAVEQCEDERRLEFVTKMMESPDYLALHRSTELNQITSELAAVEMAQEFAKLREADKKREDKNKELKAKGRPVNEARDGMKAEMDCYRAIGRGLQKAGKEVEDYEDTMTALGCGPGQGSNNKMDVGRVAQLFQRVKNNNQLKRIMELAGRYRRAAQAKQRRKVIHGHDDVVGIILDGDVGKLLPQELAMLACPETELDAMRRLVERQMLSKQYKGVERVGKGPIIVCVDESGSMSGDPVAQAKSFCLAMAWIAKHQHRWCGLVGFAGGTVGNTLALPPGKWDEKKLLEWLEHFYSGGTTLDCPLRELPEVYWPEFLSQGMKRGKTDIILVTDCQVWLPMELEKSFLKWKEAEKVKCITIVIGGTAGDLARISDNVFETDHLHLEQEGIQKCLEI